MSGNVIGGLIGGAIGFVVSGFNPAGAQWGFMIGDAVGGIETDCTVEAGDEPDPVLD